MYSDDALDSESSVIEVAPPVIRKMSRSTAVALKPKPRHPGMCVSSVSIISDFTDELRLSSRQEYACRRCASLKITCFRIGWNKACSICADERKHCSGHPNWEEPPSIATVNKTRVTPEARRDNLPDDSVQPIVAELHAIREAITLGFDSL